MAPSISDRPLAGCGRSTRTGIFASHDTTDYCILDLRKQLSSFPPRSWTGRPAPASRDVQTPESEASHQTARPSILGGIVLRTPVIYFEVKLRGWIPSVREKLDALRKKGLPERYYRRVLKEMGES